MAAGLYDIVAALQAIGAELKSTAEEATKASTAVERAKAGRGEAAGSSTGPTTANAKSSAGVTPTGLGRALQSTAGRP